MKILVISDAWKPQVNGVVRTYEGLGTALAARGHELQVIGPADFPIRMSMPGYSEIKLALFAGRRLAGMIERTRADSIHIATEGPLGRAARAWCLKHKIPFTTCYHTQFPEYVGKRVGKYLPFLQNFAIRAVYKAVRAFHAPANAMMVATQSLEDELRREGFTVPMHRWTRGVDIALFSPMKKNLFDHLPKPIALYAGRVAIEKNLEAFLSMEWHGSKVIVGDGPDLAMLQNKFPEAHFTGRKTGADLAAHYQSADIFVFPSRTDTFGMVITEALACGLPVAAYPVMGPKDIITQDILGAIDEDLSNAARKTAQAPGSREDRHNHVKTHYTWDIVAEQFLQITQTCGALLNGQTASSLHEAQGTPGTHSESRKSGSY